MRVLQAFVALAAILAAGGASAQAFKAVGGPGDAQITDLCGRQEFFITGVNYRSGLWMDQIQIICRKNNRDGTLGETITPTPARGGNGGGPNTASCKGNTVVYGIDIFLTPERQVRGVYLKCAKIAKRPLETAETEIVGSYNSRTDKWAAAQNCSTFDGNAMLGLRINYGKHVNGLGAVCNKVGLNTDKPPVGMGLPPAPVAWAAVAVNEKGASGFAVRQSSEAEAREKALAGCGSARASCKIAWAGRTRCLAYSQSTRGGYWLGIGFKDTASEATQAANEVCQRGAPAGSCVVAKATCGS